jgi:cell division septation protein DedD
MVWKVRRVVTGHDKDGKSIFIEDRHAPNVMEMASMPGLALTDLWETTGSPADNSGSKDAAARPVRLEPPKGGSILRIVEFPPDAEWRKNVDANAAFGSIGAAHAKDASNADPMMHTTRTIDYLIILKGEIYAILDKEETLLKPGDIMIQRGTNHSWSVRGTEPCILAAILIDAKPLGIAAKHAASVARKKAAKKPAAKKAATKKPAAKKPVAKKPAVKKAAPRKAARKPAAKKPVARKKAARR